MDKYVDRVVDKKKVKYSSDAVSPYLRRPLRSLADALAERSGATAPALRKADRGSDYTSDYGPANDDGDPPARPSLNHRV